MEDDVPCDEDQRHGPLVQFSSEFHKAVYQLVSSGVFCYFMLFIAVLNAVDLILFTSPDICCFFGQSFLLASLSATLISVATVGDKPERIVNHETISAKVRVG